MGSRHQDRPSRARRQSSIVLMLGADIIHRARAEMPDVAVSLVEERTPVLLDALSIAGQINYLVSLQRSRATGPRANRRDRGRPSSRPARRRTSRFPTRRVSPKRSTTISSSPARAAFIRRHRRDRARRLGLKMRLVKTIVFHGGDAGEVAQHRQVGLAAEGAHQPCPSRRPRPAGDDADALHHCAAPRKSASPSSTKTRSPPFSIISLKIICSTSGPYARSLREHASKKNFGHT